MTYRSLPALMLPQRVPHNVPPPPFLIGPSHAGGVLPVPCPGPGGPLPGCPLVTKGRGITQRLACMTFISHGPSPGRAEGTVPLSGHSWSQPDTGGWAVSRSWLSN